MATLRGKLHQTPLAQKTRLDIVAELWQDLSDGGPSDHDLNPFFDYYQIQCHHALHEQGKHVLVRTHQDIVNISEQLEDGCTREEIKENTKKLFRSKVEDRIDEDVILNNSIDLVTRLYLMVNVVSDGAKTSSVTKGKKLRWDSGNIKDVLSSHFNEPQVLDNSSMRFEKTFTARNLERIAGIKIKWTNNLADHLRMVDVDDKIVAIFHHATFIEQQTR